jgi:hypothetical protein
VLFLYLSGCLSVLLICFIQCFCNQMVELSLCICNCQLNEILYFWGLNLWYVRFVFLVWISFIYMIRIADTIADTSLPKFLSGLNSLLNLCSCHPRWDWLPTNSFWHNSIHPCKLTGDCFVYHTCVYWPYPFMVTWHGGWCFV